MKDPNGDSFDTPMSISAYEKEMIQLAKENSNWQGDRFDQF